MYTSTYDMCAAGGWHHPPSLSYLFISNSYRYPVMREHSPLHNKSSRRPQPTVPGACEVQGGCSWDMRGHFGGRGTFGSWPMRGRVGGRKSDMGLLCPPQGIPAPC